MLQKEAIRKSNLVVISPFQNIVCFKNFIKETFSADILKRHSDGRLQSMLIYLMLLIAIIRLLKDLILSINRRRFN